MEPSFSKYTAQSMRAVAFSCALLGIFSSGQCVNKSPVEDFISRNRNSTPSGDDSCLRVS